jgi:hypothetical protein
MPENPIYPSKQCFPSLINLLGLSSRKPCVLTCGLLSSLLSVIQPQGQKVYIKLRARRINE